MALANEAKFKFNRLYEPVHDSAGSYCLHVVIVSHHTAFPIDLVWPILDPAFCRYLQFLGQSLGAFPVPVNESGFQDVW